MHGISPSRNKEGEGLVVTAPGRGRQYYHAYLSLDDEITAAVQSHMLVFSLSKCWPKCIRTQSESYYKQTCKGACTHVVNEQAKKDVNH